MKSNTRFEDVFHQQLDNLYDSEKQMVEALPKMIAQASSEDLAGAFQEHLGQTKEQLIRLEIILGKMCLAHGSRKCEGMQGLLSEGEKWMAQFKKSPALDLILVTAAQKVEHYEIAGYGTACAIAQMLGQQDAFDLLETTLGEEKDADETLSDMLEAILEGDEAVTGDPLVIGEDEVEEVELDGEQIKK